MLYDTMTQCEQIIGRDLAEMLCCERDIALTGSIYPAGSLRFYGKLNSGLGLPQDIIVAKYKGMLFAQFEMKLINNYNYNYYSGKSLFKVYINAVKYLSVFDYIITDRAKYAAEIDSTDDVCVEYMATVCAHYINVKYEMLFEWLMKLNNEKDIDIAETYRYEFYKEMAFVCHPYNY